LRIPTPEAKSRLAYGEPVAIKLDIPRQDITELLAALPEALLAGKKLPTGSIEAHADLRGSAHSPSGNVDANATLVSDGRERRLEVHATVTPGARGSAVDAGVGVWLDGRPDQAATVQAHAQLTGSPILGPGWDADWNVDLNLLTQRIAELTGKADGPTGNVTAHVALRGNRRDLFGKGNVALAGVGNPRVGPLDVALGFAVEPEHTEVDLGVRANGSELLHGGGRVELGGTGLITALKTKQVGERALGVTIQIPSHTMADLGATFPALAKLPGRLAGEWRVRGTTASPVVNGDIVYDDFATLAGDRGRVAVHVDGASSELAVRVDLGAPTAGAAPVQLVLQVPDVASAIGTLKAKSGTVRLGGRARASDVDLRRLVPAFAMAGRDLGIEGRLDWQMDFGADLAVSGETKKLVNAALRGTLGVSKGKVRIPESGRVYDNVEVKIASDADALRIVGITARESDRQKSGRSVGIRGQMAWNGLKPGALALDVNSSDWLLFGGSLGAADAPRGTLTADLGVRVADLGAPVKKVRIEVRALEMLVPERFARALQPEATSLGDVAFVGEPGVRVGSLPVPKRAEVVEPPKAGEVQEARGAEIEIDLSRGVHVQQAPLDLWASGALRVVTRPGGRDVRGKLTVQRGKLYAFGKFHDLDQGSVVFDDANPKGYIDFNFKRPAHVAALRNISLESGAGGNVVLALRGPVGGQKVAMSGAANSFFFEVGSFENDGRPRVVSTPATPGTTVVQGPRLPEVVQSTYMSVHLPHLLFLDRMVYWADPYEDRTSYGRTDRLDAERYGADGKTRLHVTSRPPHR
jgi:hypothetical protein